MQLTNYILIGMDFSHLRALVRAEDIEIIAIGECIGDTDQRIIMLYREYLLVRLLARRDRDNSGLQTYLHDIYWKLIRDIRSLEMIVDILGFRVLAITRELELNQHNN